MTTMKTRTIKQLEFTNNILLHKVDDGLQKHRFFLQVECTRLYEVSRNVKLRYVICSHLIINDHS